jgi:hypothetical protein
MCAREKTGKTYEAQGEDAKRRDSMEKHPHAKYAHILQRDHQIPQEVPSSKGLNKPTRPSVPMYSFPLIHSIPLPICPHNPQREPADDGRLHKGHNVHVPVQFGARIKGRVDAREEVAAEDWRDVFVGNMVEDEGEGYFVEVEREGLQVKIIGNRLDVFDKTLWAGERERVVHRGDSGCHDGGGGREGWCCRGEVCGELELGGRELQWVGTGVQRTTPTTGCWRSVFDCADKRMGGDGGGGCAKLIPRCIDVAWPGSGACAL